MPWYLEKSSRAIMTASCNERGLSVINIVYGYSDLPKGISSLLVNLSSIYSSHIAITIAQVNRDRHRLTSKHAVVE